MQIKSVFRHLLIWGLRLFIAVILLLVLAIAGGVAWLATDDGQALVQEQFRTILLSGTGYQVKADKIAFQFPLSAAIPDLTIADNKGIWLHIKGLEIGVLPTPDMQQHIRLHHVQASSVELLRQPEAVEVKTQNTGGKAPDVSIYELEIGKLLLGTELIGQEKPQTLGLNGALEWQGDTKEIGFQAKANHISGLPAQLADLTVTATGDYQLANQQLTIENIALQSKEAEAEGSAQLDVAKTAIKAALDLKNIDIASYVPGAKGMVNGTVALEGALANPLIKAKLEGKDFAYQDYQAPEVNAEISAQMQKENWVGKLVLGAGKEIGTSANYTWNKKQLKLDKLTAFYQKNTVNGAVVIALDNYLVNGKLVATIPEIAALKDHLPPAVQGKVKGSVAVNATLSGKAGKQVADVELNGLHLNYEEMSAASLKIKAHFSDLYSRNPDKIDAVVTEFINGDTTIDNAVLNATRLKNTWKGSFNSAGFAGEEFNLRTAGEVSYQSFSQFSGQLKETSGQYGKWPFSAAAPVNIAFNQQTWKVAIPEARIASGKYQANGSLAGDNIAAEIAGSDIVLSELMETVPDGLKHARAKLSANLKGTLASPRGDARLDIAGITLHSATPKANFSGDVKADNGGLHINGKLSDERLIVADLNASIPIFFRFSPFKIAPDRDKVISGSTHFSLEVKRISQLFLPAPHSLAGAFKGDFTLGGTFDHPTMNGRMGLEEGEYRYPPIGMVLRHMDLQIAAEGQTFRLESFRAQDRDKNTLTGSGTLEAYAADRFTFALALKGQHLKLVNHPNVRSAVSANLNLQGNESQASINGAVTNELTDIYLPDRFATKVPELNVIDKTAAAKRRRQKEQEKKPDYDVKLDVDLKAENQVFVRGWGVDAELKGNLDLTGTMGDPGIKGKLSTIRGRYDEFGKQFTLKEAEILFEGKIPPSPFIKFVASAKAEGVEVMPTLSGNLLEPELTIESVPAMPPEEALSLLLFGKNSNKISLIQAAQLATSMQRLAGKGGSTFDAMGRLRKLLKVDDIRINNNGDSAAAASVGVGKYISDKVYLEVEQGAEEQSSKAKVSIDVSPNISVESSTGATGQNTVGVMWKRDY